MRGDPLADELPPDALDERGRRLWRLALEELVEQGTWRPVDAETLERLCLADRRAREARARLEQSGPTTVGSMGQPVIAPDLRIAREAERDVLELSEALLLTPSARARAGVMVEPEPEDDRLTEIIAARAARRADNGF